MKQYRFLFAIFAAAALSFTACSDDQVTQDEPSLSSEDSARLQVRYIGILNGMKGYNMNAKTRHTIDSVSTWAGMVSRRMSICLNSTTPGSEVVYDNYYVDAAGNITASMGPYIFGTAATTYNAIAWYPYTKATDFPTNQHIINFFAVQDSQNVFANIEKSDLILGAQTSGTTEINFYHHMSQIEMHIHLNRYKITGNTLTKIRSYVDSVRLIGMKMGGAVANVNNLVATGQLTIADFTPSNDINGDGVADDPDTIECWHYQAMDSHVLDGAIGWDTTFSYRALVFPQTTDMYLLVKVHDAVFGDTVYKGKIESWTYQPGVYYNIYVNITDQLSQTAKSAPGRKGEAVETKPTMIITRDEGQPWR
jgi:hypothetical protein